MLVLRKAFVVCCRNKFLEIGVSTLKFFETVIEITPTKQVIEAVSFKSKLKGSFILNQIQCDAANSRHVSTSTNLIECISRRDRALCTSIDNSLCIHQKNIGIADISPVYTMCTGLVVDIFLNAGTDTCD